MKINKSTQKNEHNTKQIKYRRKLHLTLLSLSIFGLMVSYLIIYLKNNTEHNEIREKARRIQAGICTEQKLTSNWYSRADTLSLPLLPACVFVIRDTVRHPRLFARNICSRTGAFVNRGSTVSVAEHSILLIELREYVFLTNRSWFWCNGIGVSRYLVTSSDVTVLVYRDISLQVPVKSQTCMSRSDTWLAKNGYA
jgi:hypothetical protein